MCDQKRSGSKDRAVEKNDGFGFGIGGVPAVVNIAFGPQAAHDLAAWCGTDGLALEADGNFAVVADAHGGALAPEAGPPRASRNGAQQGAFFGQGLLEGGVRGGAKFTMDFVLIDMGQELVEQRVGTGQFDDLVGGQQGREASSSRSSRACLSVEPGSKAWGLASYCQRAPRSRACQRLTGWGGFLVASGG